MPSSADRESPRRSRSRAVGAWLLAAALLATAVVGACAEKKGALMLAINTDMKAPKDVNAVSVTISTNGAIKHSFIGRVTPQGEVLLPATLAIAEPDDPSATIRVRVMAFQEGKPRVMRDVRTTIPTGGRVALLRIPLNFVNDGSAVGAVLPAGLVPDPLPGTGGTASGGTFTGGAVDFDFFGSYQPPCPDIQNQTIIDGECKDNYVDPATLPDFDQNALGDSTNPGSCFDVPKCFVGAVGVGDGTGTDGAPASAVALDRTTCTLQLNGADPARLNLAIVTPDTGECLRPGECYIPIDRGPTGWQDHDGSVQLPTYLCTLLTKSGVRLATSADACAAKEERNPSCEPQPGDTRVDDAGTVTGPRRLIAADFATWTGSAQNGNVYVASAKGLERYDAVQGDGSLATGSQTLVAGDGTNVPRVAWFWTADVSSYVLTEGARAHIVRAGQPQQDLSFGAPIVGVGFDATDIIVATAVRSGPAVFRVPLSSNGPAAPPTAFTNGTGKLVSSVVGLTPAGGFALGFEDGSFGECEGTEPCTTLTFAQSFPGVGRIDWFAADPRNDPQIFGYIHHSAGITRLDHNGQSFSPVDIVSADLTGLTSGSNYYYHGASIDPLGCVYFADAANRVRFKHLPTQSEGVIAQATAHVGSISYVAIGGQPPTGQSFVTWTVSATAAEGGGVWGAPIPEVCKVDASAPDAGADAGADAGGPQVCPTTTPIDATAFPWKSPTTTGRGTCTQSDLDALVAFVDANPNATAADIAAFLTARNAACSSCVVAVDGPTWAPLIEAGGVITTVNIGGCIALVSSNDNCGKAYQQWVDCLNAACTDCSTPALFTACRSTASNAGGACTAASNAAISACGSAATVSNAEAACITGMKYEFEGPVKAQCIGSIP